MTLFLIIAPHANCIPTIALSTIKIIPPLIRSGSHDPTTLVTNLEVTHVNWSSILAITMVLFWASLAIPSSQTRAAKSSIEIPLGRVGWRLSINPVIGSPFRKYTSSRDILKGVPPISKYPSSSCRTSPSRSTPRRPLPRQTSSHRTSLHSKTSYESNMVWVHT